MLCLTLECSTGACLSVFHPPGCGGVLEVAEPLGAGVWLQTESVDSWCPSVHCAVFMGVTRDNKTRLLDCCDRVLTSFSHTVPASHAVNCPRPHISACGGVPV